MPKPPTPMELGRKLSCGVSRTGRRFEPAKKTESDEDDYQPLLSRRMADKIPTLTLPPVEPESLEAGVERQNQRLRARERAKRKADTGRAKAKSKTRAMRLPDR